MGAQVDGVDRFRSTLATAGEQLTGLVDAHTEAGRLLAQAAASRSPHRTGRLSESHGFTVEHAGFTVTAAAPYAGFVHARNPWLARELDADTQTIIDIYAAHVADVVDHITGA
jgi:hypothetical protein